MEDRISKLDSVLKTLVLIMHHEGITEDEVMVCGRPEIQNYLFDNPPADGRELHKHLKEMIREALPDASAKKAELLADYAMGCALQTHLAFQKMAA